MKIARIEIDGQTKYVVVEKDGFHVMAGSPFEQYKLEGKVLPLNGARAPKILSPVSPRQIIAIGLNYRKHAEESGMAIPGAPLVFVKTSNTIIGPGEPIILPDMAPNEVDYEAELVIVIGKSAKNVAVENVSEYILGYTCGNDVSARDCQLRLDKQWARGKCFDTFAPIGPWVETDLDGDNLDICLKLNGQTLQKSNTSDMIFSCSELVSYLSQCMTIEPGSIIFTGTPEGVGFGRKPQVFLRENDEVSVEIGGIGMLTNTVRKEQK